MAGGYSGIPMGNIGPNTGADFSPYMSMIESNRRQAAIQAQLAQQAQENEARNAQAQAELAQRGEYQRGTLQAREREGVQAGEQFQAGLGLKTELGRADVEQGKARTALIGRGQDIGVSESAKGRLHGTSEREAGETAAITREEGREDRATKREDVKRDEAVKIGLGAKNWEGEFDKYIADSERGDAERPDHRKLDWDAVITNSAQGIKNRINKEMEDGPAKLAALEAVDRRAAAYRGERRIKAKDAYASETHKLTVEMAGLDKQLTEGKIDSQTANTRKVELTNTLTEMAVKRAEEESKDSFKVGEALGFSEEEMMGVWESFISGDTSNNPIIAKLALTEIGSDYINMLMQTASNVSNLAANAKEAIAGKVTGTEDLEAAAAAAKANVKIGGDDSVLDYAWMYAKYGNPVGWSALIAASAYEGASQLVD